MATPDIALSIGFKDQKNAQNVLSSLRGQIQGFSTSGTSALSGLAKGFGAIGLAVGALAVVKKVLTESINAFMGYEDALKSLQSITGVGAEGLGFYSDAAKRLATETTIATGDVVKAFELIGSAQPELLKNEKALVSVTEAAITLAEASGLALPDAATRLTDAMNQFGIAASGANKVIDILAVGSKEGAAAIPLITDAMLKFGAVAKSANVSIAESTAAIEVLAARGIKGAEAGTALRNVLLSLSAADALPKKAQEAFKEVGIDVNVLRDNSLSLQQRLGEMGKAANDTSALTKIFGKENVVAGRVILQNTDLLADLTGKMSQSGLAAEQAGQRTSTLSSVFKKFGNQINIALIDLGKEFAPFVRAFLDGFMKIFNVIKPIVVGMVNTLSEFGQAIGGLIGDLFGASEAGDGFSLILDGLKLSFMAITKPTQLILQGITWLIEKFRIVRDAVDDFFEGLGPLGEGLRMLLNPIATVQRGITALVDGFNELFGTADDAATFADAWKQLGGAAGAVKAFGDQTGATRKEMAMFLKTINPLEFAELSVGEATKLLVERFKEFKKTLGGGGGAVVEMTGLLEGLTARSSDLSEAMNKAGSVEEIIKIQKELNAVNAQIDDIKQKVGFAILADENVGKVFIEVDSKSVQDAGGLIRDLGEETRRTVSDIKAPEISLSSLREQLAELNAAFDGALTDAARIEIAGKIFDVEAQISDIERLKESLWTLKDAVSGIKDALVQGFTDIAFSIGEAVAGAATAMDVFKQVLNLLLVQIPKMIGIAMINQAAAVPSPLSLPLAIAGAALVGLSGLFSGIINKKGKDVQEIAQSAQTGGAAQSTAQAVPGLSGFGADSQQNQFNIQVMLDGQSLENAVTNVFENGQEVRGRR